MKSFGFSISLFIFLILSNFSYSQGEIIDDFSKMAMPGWIWGGVEMKYSHTEDNRENGFADIFTTKPVEAGAYIGKILLKKKYLLTAGNYLDVMLKGVNNDAKVKIQLIYDIDNNTFYDEKADVMLTSNPISLDFDGWKEIKLKLDEENFKIITNTDNNFEVTEDEIFGIQFEFEAGKNYKSSNFESGIALISEIINKEVFTDYDQSSSSSSKTESYFNASNQPNPFNPSTTIKYTLPQSTYVSLEVYDRLGRPVATLVNQNQEAGDYEVDFNAGDLPSGIYFYRIKTTEKTEVRKMLFSK